MHQMNWLKKFNQHLSDTKLNYDDNEYDSSGFNPVNLKLQDNIKSRKEIEQVEKESRHNSSLKV